jgi:hypothetical protein
VALYLLVVSYLNALTFPGQASTEVRTVDWVRDIGGNRLVDSAENWWYTRHAPSTAAPARLRSPLDATKAGVSGVTGWPAPLRLISPAIGPRTTSGEGHWNPGPATIGAVPAMFQTFIRPDPTHPGVVAAIARFDQHLITAQLIAGTAEPSAHTARDSGEVPSDRRADLLATFNSGFKMADALGGYYAHGQVVRPLRAGAASLVIDHDGHIRVEMWNRDSRLNPTIAAVRQNLALIVDHRRVVPGLDANAGIRWGDSGNQRQYTWRSALGVDAAGNLYYVAGDQLTLATLARALADTGAVRGMELDIHPQMVNMFLYRHSPTGITPTGTRLMPAMDAPVNRYLVPDQRDFIALFRRDGHPAEPLAQPNTPTPDSPTPTDLWTNTRWTSATTVPVTAARTCLLTRSRPVSVR